MDHGTVYCILYNCQNVDIFSYTYELFLMHFNYFETPIFWTTYALSTDLASSNKVICTLRKTKYNFYSFIARNNIKYAYQNNYIEINKL